MTTNNITSYIFLPSKNSCQKKPIPFHRQPGKHHRNNIPPLAHHLSPIKTTLAASASTLLSNCTNHIYLYKGILLPFHTAWWCTISFKHHHRPETPLRNASRSQTPWGL